VTTTQTPSPAAVLDEIRAMLLKVLDNYGLDEVEIGRDSLFHDDLGLESIDLVEIGNMLFERYGAQVNLAAFLADKELDDVIGLRIGQLVDFVVTALGGQAVEA
jgi:acyl carrier protein